MRTTAIRTVLACATVLAATETASAQELWQIPMFRLELVVHTCDASNAGTDDEVYVKLSDNMPPQYLDVGGDDRQRNGWNRYDLDPSGFGNSTTGIQYIRLGKAGGDAWCVDEVQLYMNRNDGVRSVIPSSNNNIFYTGVYTPHWINGSGQYPSTYTYAGIHLAAWYTPGLIDSSTVIRTQTILDMYESAYGHEMSVVGQMYNYGWGDRDGAYHAEIGPGSTPYSDGHLDLDLKKSGSGEKDYDVNFGAVINCSGANGPLSGFFFQKSGSVTIGGNVADAAINSVASAIATRIGTRLRRHPVFNGLTCPSTTSTYIASFRTIYPDYGLWPRVPSPD